MEFSSRSNRRPSRARALLLFCLVAAVAAIGAAVAASGTGVAVPRAFEATHRAHVAVSALPGVDLGPVMDLPGVSAASGPFPTVTIGARHGRRDSDLRLEARPSGASAVDRPLLLTGSWARAGSIVLEQRLARALRVRPGSRITISSAGGPTSVRVAGIAATTSESHAGYVTPQTLERLVPNGRTYGSTLYLRVSDPDSSQRYIAWIRRSYPTQQVEIRDWHSLETPAGASASIALIGAFGVLLGTAALLTSVGRLRHRPLGSGVEPRKIAT